MYETARRRGLREKQMFVDGFREGFDTRVHVERCVAESRCLLTYEQAGAYAGEVSEVT